MRKNNVLMSVIRLFLDTWNVTELAPSSPPLFPVDSLVLSVVKEDTVEGNIIIAILKYHWLVSNLASQPRKKFFLFPFNIQYAYLCI